MGRASRPSRPAPARPVLAAAASWLEAGFLIGVSAPDPLTFLVMPALLLAVAGLASWLPARCAAGVDPSETIRSD